MKEAVAGELAAAYHSAIVDRRPGQRLPLRHRPADGPPRPRVRVLLRRRSRGGLRLPGPRALSRAGRSILTGEIIHNPHVNDQLRAADIRFLTDPGERWDTLGPDDVVILPAFGVTVGDMARLVRPGLHPGRHDVRVGAERLEERRPLRAGRLHRGHPRQGAPRGDPGDRVAGAEVSARPLSRRAGSGGSRGGLRLHPPGSGGDRAAFTARFAARSSPGFDPAVDLDRVGCANQTTMLMSESLAIGEMFREAMTRALRRRRAGGPLPGVRHDLQRDAGAAGRRRRRCSTRSGST